MSEILLERAVADSAGSFRRLSVPLYRRRLAIVGTTGLVLATLFLLLLIPRWPILFSPPYVEQAGLWTEAAFLEATDFDYSRLRSAERHGDEGGPRAYMYSALASFIAVLMRYGEPPHTFLLYRLFTIACAAIILWNLMRLLAPKVGILAAALAAVALATVPLFSVQVEMLGMDLPMVMVASWSAVCVRRRCFGAVALLSLAAFAMKNSGFLLSAAATFYLLLMLFAGKDQTRDWRRIRGRGLAVNAVACAFEVFVLVAGDSARTRMHFPRASDLYFWRVSVPDVTLTIAVALAISVWGFWQLIQAQPRRRGASLAIRQALLEVDNHDGLLLYGWIVIGLSTFLVLPVFFEARYLCLPLFFLYVVLVEILFADRSRNPIAIPLPSSWSRAIGFVGLGGLLIFNVANRNGTLYEPIRLQSARGWGVPERSHEYRADHNSNIAAARLLERECRGHDLLVSDQFTYFLTVPQLGYVSQSLRAGLPVWRFDADDQNLRELVRRAPRELVVTYVPPQRDLAFPAYVIAPPGAGDQILYNDGLRPSNIIYRRAFPAEASASRRIELYLDLLFADAQSLDPLAKLAVLGWIDLARDYLQDELTRPVTNDELRRILSERLDFARASLARSWNRPPGDPFHERLLHTMAQRQRCFADASLSLESIPPLSFEARGLSIELPQRLLFLSGDSSVSPTLGQVDRAALLHR
jgi:hypothetical protein